MRPEKIGPVLAARRLSLYDDAGLIGRAAIAPLVRADGSPYRLPSGLFNGGCYIDIPAIATSLCVLADGRISVAVGRRICTS